MLANAIVWIINAVISGYCIAVVGQRYRKKTSQATLALLILFISFVGANLGSAFNALFRETWGGIQYGYAIALLFLGSGTVALLYFSIEVFSSSDPSKFVTVVQMIFSLLVLVICVWGAILLITAQQNTTMVLALEILLAVTIHLIVSVKAIRLAKRVEDPFFRRSINFIALYCLCMLFMFMCYILDSGVSIVIENNAAREGETIWSFIGSITYSVAILLAYIGYVKPMREH
jgi:hypothetical protein